MKPRRILIFSLAYFPRLVAGAEVAVKEITDRIPSSEIEFDMITVRSDRPKTERIGNVLVHRVGMPWYGNANNPIFFISKYLYMPCALWKALRLHAARSYEATWSIMANY